MCLDEFGWTDSEAVLYLGIAMTVGGIIAMGCFLSVGPLAKRYINCHVAVEKPYISDKINI